MAVADKLAMSPSVPGEVAQAVADLARALHSRLGDSLLTLTLYGSAARGGFGPGSDVNLLIVVDDIDAKTLWDMEAILDRLPKTVRLAPYLVTRGEWPQVARAFPTRLMEMKRGHLVLHGQDLLASTDIDRADLEVRCRQELLNLVLRFRHQMLGSDDPECLEKDLRGYLPPLVKTLRSLLFVRTGQYHEARESVLRAAAGELGIPLEPLLQFSAWRDGVVSFSGQEYREATETFLDILLRLVKAF